MGSRATRHTRGALALGLALLCSLTALGCSGDEVSSPTGASITIPPPGPLVTSFDTAHALGRADAEGARVTTAAAHTGTRGLEIQATGGEAYVRWAADVLGEGRPYWSFRAWMRVADWTAGESVDLFTVRNLELKHNFDLFVGAPSRRLQWDLYREDYGETPSFELGRWYLVEARGSFATSTFTADVRIDGERQTSITSTDQTPSAVAEIVLGSIGTAKRNRAQFDDFRVEVAETPLPFLGRPTPPRGETPRPERSSSPERSS